MFISRLICGSPHLVCGALPGKYSEEKMKKENVDQYLKDHPDFVKKWVITNVSPSTLRSWAALEPGPSSNSQDEMKNVHPASDFPVAEAKTKSIFNLSLSPTSFTSKKFTNMLQEQHSRIQNEQSTLKSTIVLNSMSEQALILELIRDVATELDPDRLCHKILRNVSLLTKCDRGSLFLASREEEILRSKLFDVQQGSTYEESLRSIKDGNIIEIPFGKGIAGTVAETKTAINLKDAYKDPRFNKEVDRKTGFRTKALLCMPILNHNGDIMGVAQIMNKIDSAANKEFTKEDENLFKTYLSFCGIGLANAHLFEMSVTEYNRNQLLLQLARNVFEHQSNLDNLVKKIMSDSQKVLCCERCRIYLLDIEKEKDKVMFKKIFEIDSNGKSITTDASKENSNHSKIVRYAQEVVNTGEVINIKHALDEAKHNDERKESDITIHNLLSLPIRNRDHNIMGVVQLINKKDAKSFVQDDIFTLEAFAVFCGLGIHNCEMYENVVSLMAKQSVALDILSYHASASDDATHSLINKSIKSSKLYNLHSYAFDDWTLTDDMTVEATLRMFLDLNVIETFNVSYKTLCRWTLSVKKNYRPVTYHNWRHAFNVAQTMFAMFFVGKMTKYLDTLERFGLLVACLCHDLDHRGTNNSFQVKSASPLAQLYSTSTMEHHHFDQCVMILSSEGNNIFQSLDSINYRRIISIVEHAILSTDLALYFKKKGSFQKLIDDGEKLWNKDETKDLMKGMMMTACDVSAIAKPWDVQWRVAHLVASEFFEQGDLERQHLHEEPMAMMDRQKQDQLPKMQVGFIDSICLPVYKLLSHSFPGLEPLYKQCYENRMHWQHKVNHPRPNSSCSSGDSSTDVVSNQPVVGAVSSRLQQQSTTVG